ncbi:uncharacterized protein PAC_05699 [Phialocephala subalpina]|uniref:AIG1-type G domain-containing protein n=1 Tax=Phialocephala subalpina TaxID=576137 RepID=A0A1L7WSR3_9HELO|nr:uncharacterized protein PAC_05699 [Phialocephala subalpina]
MPVSPSNEGMVLVMGVTGAGKSYFVNKLKEGSTVEGATLTSCTSVCQIVETYVGDTKVAVVDCPGFDDTKRSDTEILSVISELVTAQYHMGMKLWGIVFLHRITDVRFQGSTQNVLSLFQQLVGDDALSNVVLVTTQWGRVTHVDMPDAINREQQLRDEYWREMLDKNSMTRRFDDSRASAEGIIALLIGRDNVVLRLQKELVDEKKALGKTAAGLMLGPKVDKKLKASKDDVKRLRAELQKKPNNTRRLRIQREILEAEERIAKGESDEARLGKKVGVDLIDKLKRVDWTQGLKIALSVLGFAVTIVSLVLGGGQGGAF